MLNTPTSLSFLYSESLLWIWLFDKLMSSPGMVSSDMGLEAAKGFGMSIEEIGAITPSESAKSLLTVIDAAKKDSHGGKFWNYTGEELKW